MDFYFSLTYNHKSKKQHITEHKAVEMVVEFTAYLNIVELSFNVYNQRVAFEVFPSGQKSLGPLLLGA